MNRSADIFEEVARLRREGIPAAMATIVDTRGSTPGRESMRLLVLADGTFLGTVGGGCLEAEVYEAALEVIKTEQPRTLKFTLTKHDSPDSGLLCGGTVAIFVEPITAPVLTVFGAGHISKALCVVASLAGFQVRVVDDRQTYASTERFPEAQEAIAQSYPEAVAEMAMQPNSYVVIATRGHKEDGLVLQELAKRHAAGDQLKFLGMIGSRTKKSVLFRHLRERGVAEDFLQTVRSPVGLCLGARSHEEIAVSIVGELVSVRRLGTNGEGAWQARPPRGEREEASRLAKRRESIENELQEPWQTPQEGAPAGSGLD